ncbi:MAG: 1-deoxy-D-xylulose-5-phosphate synthase [Bacillota bacterium]|uniref:1-deoxy-D-xylulose-5-phosphate synthase n=1 Tax=Desulfurispora thermophila TaxID=265470 RepID=UPI00036AEBD4|nr:1-deoxy-D-xylulose-5-phosphate synthase [Desulfurispora thermophila]
MSLLQQINSPADLKAMPAEQLPLLAEEIRQEIIHTVAQNGGHLAPNLGVVELTLALHRVFTTPRDKIIWDVGHQCYVHKLLTGRREQFATLRQYGGISGFPRPLESSHDAFATGHSSTSVSAALGMALARDLQKQQHHVIAVIGDGALTGGMALEALNHAGHLQCNLIVVLNDNEMSIAQNVGGISKYLSRLRSDPKYTRGKEELENILKRIPNIGSAVLKMADRLKDAFKYLVVPGMFFEEMGFTYLGPVNGHDLPELVHILQQAKALKGPVLVHVLTQKGRGYQPALADPDTFHGIAPFDIATGQLKKKSPLPTYTQVFGQFMLEMGAHLPGLVAITAAMPGGTGLKAFAARYPERFFDVGIAEQHAVTLAAGLASQGLRPVVAIYSTFLQRAYDQIVHDVCLSGLPVTFAIDRGGLVGDDGPTHHGVFDFSYLRHLPNMVIMAPGDENELRQMLYTALQHDGPVAVRYPRGSGTGCPLDQQLRPIPLGSARVLQEGDQLTLLAAGSMVQPARQAAQELARRGIATACINARFIKPLDEKLILHFAARTGRVITVEENVLAGGFGSAVLELLQQHGLSRVQVVRLGVPDCFITHGSRDILLQQCGLTSEQILAAALQLVKEQERPRQGRLKLL